MGDSEESGRLEGPDLTSIHLGRAREGVEESLSWVVAHFTPFLQMQAEYRVQGGMRRLHDPEDIVDEVWMVALPRISELNARDGHWTPVLMRFLATTLLNRVNRHLSRHLRAEMRSLPTSSDSGSRGSSPGRRASPATSVVGAVARNEARAMLDEVLLSLEPDERELLVLRGIEQHPGQEVARRFGVEPSTISRRYQRLLRKLRSRLPGTIFDELPD